MFRNLDADPSDPVETWPYEGLVTAIERGAVSDWGRIVAAIRRSPWGSVARAVEDYARDGDEQAVSALLTEAIGRARKQIESDEREEVARRVRAAVQRSGLPARLFAREIGTSPSRLSTYCTGAVTPGAGLLVRIERVGSGGL